MSTRDNCRICLKSRKSLHSLNKAVNGVTFLNMLSSVANLKIITENSIPDMICLPCRNKLCQAYDFKLTIIRSEEILNETSSSKRFSFNNINDIKLKIKNETPCKTMIPIIEKYNENSFKNLQTINYNDIVIKRIKEEPDEKKETTITVKEFLNSVKLESDNDCDDYEPCMERDSDNDSDYIYGVPLQSQSKIKMKKKQKSGNKSSKCGRATKKNQILNKPIKPIYLGDLRMQRYIPPPNNSVIRKQKPKRPQPKAPTSVCAYCGKIMSVRSLDTHILTHTGEKSFKCDKCPKVFYNAQSLKSHQSKHGDKIYKCELCIGSFSYPALLKNHMAFVHSDEKKYICDVCNKAFKRKTHLLRHQTIHNFTPKAVKCEKCTMTFYTQSNLRHHMRIHTRERPYKCEICSQPYSYKRDFNRHCFKKHGVFIARRPVPVMNEEVLQRELALMRDLTLYAHGVIELDSVIGTFNGPDGPRAFKEAIEAVKKISISC